jgi:hypothetical protein
MKMDVSALHRYSAAVPMGLRDSTAHDTQQKSIRPKECSTIWKNKAPFE